MLFLFYELLANVGLVLIWVVETLKCSVGEETLISAAKACLLIIVLALLRYIEELIWGSTVIERLVSVNTVVPIVVFCSIAAILSFVSVKIEKSRLHTF